MKMNKMIVTPHTKCFCLIIYNLFKFYIVIIFLNIHFRVNGELVHTRIRTKQEFGWMKYFDGQTLWFDFLNDLIESLKHSSHTCHKGVLTNKFTLKEPITKE